VARRKKRIPRRNRRIYLLIALAIIIAGLAATYIADFFHTASLWDKEYYYPHDREREDHLMDQEDESR
jgi:hypothetical protein